MFQRDSREGVDGEPIRILLSNDDGIDAPGLAALEAVLGDFGEVWVVAPAAQQSAKSHALSMHKPLQVEQRGVRRYAVGGTPVDSVYVAVHSLLPDPPDLVVSGINRGANIGEDIHYSGTVAAAREGVLLGVPAIAFSLHVDFSRPSEAHHWETATLVAQRVIGESLRNPFPRDCVLNVNVPDVPRSALEGIRACEQGHHFYEPLVDLRRDPRGKTYCWLGGAHSNFGEGVDSEGHLVEEGWATISPLTVRVTDHAALNAISAWDGLGSLTPE